ncbi:MAG: Alpha/beta hydrolase fold, partial [Ilumatobacteraceae bacterium]|nr:Alpha/beta hydrolase fold [Ilumatobacteraceae bacterium]
VLLNSVGDPGVFPANGGTGGSDARGHTMFTRVLDAMRPPVEDLATTTLIQRALLENMWRNPFAVMHAAHLAMSADLTAEMAELARRELPVLVLWSDRDRLVPLTAFDTFCSTFGTDGKVVRGGHSWLLANPDVFGEVLDNVIQVQSAEHGVRATTANISELRELLAHTTLPRAVATRLLNGVSPLWALSESPAVLAGDLALCHPKLRPGEVRAVARQMPGTNTFRLTVAAEDRPGFLADTAGTLAGADVSVEAASVMTTSGGRLALHALTVRSRTPFDEERWTAIGGRLRETAEGSSPSYRFVPTGRARVTRSGEGIDTSIVRVTAPDRIGLLSAICRWFADHGVSIEAADISTVDGNVNDVFLIDGECDTDLLARHLSGPSSSFSASPASLLSALRRCRLA